MTRIHVLLVENNPLLRDWIRASLEDEGFDVTATASLAEAHEAGAAWPFDVLITDWRVANRTAFDVLAVLQPMWPGVVPVLIAADADSAVVERAHAAGFRTVLQKPFPPWKIAEAIRQQVAAPCEVAV